MKLNADVPDRFDAVKTLDRKVQGWLTFSIDVVAMVLRDAPEPGRLRRRRRRVDRRAGDFRRRNDRDRP
jgi:hypothetical protein